MDYDSAVEYLLTRVKFGMKLGLSEIKKLLKKIGNPEKSYKTIHITGTNGKGSVSSLIAKVLEKSGYKVGLYTSPHLVDFRERIQINGELISKDDITRLTEYLKELVDNETYFEIITSLAFLYFKEQKVDVAVIEVGLGGRLDATNVIIPEISVITRISLEHIEHLGNTTKKIAFEKAGIIKRNVPTVTGATGDSLGVIRRKAKEMNSLLYFVDENYNKYETSLYGSYQKFNSSVALKAIHVLRERRFKITDDSIKIGFKSAKWPGRMQFIEKDFLVDCAHNTDGAEALSNELFTLRKSYDKILFVTGIMKDKDISQMCDYFEKYVDEFIITRPKLERASDTNNISKHIKKPFINIESVSSAVKHAILLKKDLESKNISCLLVISGSIFLIGEVFQSLNIVPFEK